MDIRRMVDDTTQRAFRAWFRSGGTEQPAEAASGPASAGGRDYVCLRNTNGLLAVYSVNKTGRLRRLDEAWPAELEHY